MSIEVDTKTCPFCAEMIKKEAVVCRFCGYDLRTGTPATTNVTIEPETPLDITPIAGSQSSLTEPPVVQARSGIMDGVKIGAGMFIVLPLLLCVGLLLICSLGGMLSH